MNAYAVWFRRVVQLGVLGNLSIAIPVLIAPNPVMDFLGLPRTLDPMWPRLAAQLAILLSLFYLPAAKDPFRYRTAARLAVFARWAGVVFIFAGFPAYAPIGLLDLVFGLSEGVLLYLAYRAGAVAPPPADATPTPERAKRQAMLRKLAARRSLCVGLGLTAVISAYVGWLAWFHLYREEPVPYYADRLDNFKYGSVGTEINGLPYWIWLVLPRLFPEHLPAGGGYNSLGFLWEGRKGDKDAPELPVGFSVQTIGFPRVNMNCALCHTGTYRTSENAEPTLVEGMPPQGLDPQNYLRFLFACASDPRFTADNILREISYHTRLSPTEQLLYRHLLIPRTRQALLDQKKRDAWMEEWVGHPPIQRPDWGRGRVDPFNPIKFGMLDRPWDDSLGNCDFLPLWKMPENGAPLHWDGLNRSITEVVRSSSLGVGATEKNIPLKRLERLEADLHVLAPPDFPYSADRPKDEAKFAAGEKLYARECASCHASEGARYRTVIPWDEPELRTDRERLDQWSQADAATYNNFVKNPKWRFRTFQKTNGYVATGLDGLWLRAPYLHNGSVPTLRDLLNRPEDRPGSFWRGSDVYDFKNLGFVSTDPKARGTAAGKPQPSAGGRSYPPGKGNEGRYTYIDTRVPGESNQGHLYGTDLKPEQKEALLEFLKSL